MKADFLLSNCGQMATLQGPKGPRRLSTMDEPALLENAALASFEGRILAVGSSADVLKKIELLPGAREEDAGGALVTPGFVDPHTHALFGRYRYEEYDLRVRGRAYTEIAAAGGGIHASVRDFRERSDGELLELSRPRLNRMMQAGSTTIEIKSGYGLSLEEELRAMSLIGQLSKEVPAQIVPTFLGAHEIPEEFRGEKREDYLRSLCEEWIPAAAEQGIAAYVDVFCEPTVFSLEESRRILEAARSHGLGRKIHADEIEASYGGAALAAELGAVSADHLIVMNPDHARNLANSSTLAVLLPATSLGLATTEFADARSLIEAGVAVALATDFNPGSSCCESMGTVLSLACSALRMSPAEALCASTYNAACACGEEEYRGSLDAGKRADFLIHDAGDYRELPYHLGFPSVQRVFIGGREVRIPASSLLDRPGFADSGSNS
ncbi:MAG: imidazolonepropionase [Candidatus Krumholzibacteria bacterium]|jgi:imidazolonepropionase|nr:imidazolonepropionase [Candidatus Krumholzibacteria bacterium]MDP6669285.1 imidazolonepropionase [Candidatus Krumholzibacteria bacterium]MDP6796692.1 imidazolonepropionase [Candidatus Krumholzibacteria bacterium]MDP7020749.1 imidazolonepropionase [Candidatus Krumholzibacteria bacterium]